MTMDFIVSRTFSLFLLVFWANAEIANKLPSDNGNNKLVRVYKCCESYQIYVGKYCTDVNKTNRFQPLFYENTATNVQLNFTYLTGKPDCGSMQPWSIYHYFNSADRLQLLTTGILRHYFDHSTPNEEAYSTFEDTTTKSLYYDYEPGKYCIDKRIDGNLTSEFAWVCTPDHEKEWLTSTEFLMRNIINPITHGIGIICLLTTAIIYFVLPTLRDLTGNIVTTICMCLLVSQIGDMIRLLTVFTNHISLIITETICYVSLLGAFFWLNSLGYYIWKTFRSRNVFLRITDGKKYCYYCGYATSCTLTLGLLAIFAHFALDYPDVQPALTFEQQREQIGSLGMILFFVPVACTVLMDVFFFATTLKTINKMHTYGRIHHKLRHSFRMFLLLLLVMTLWWLFFLTSFSKFEGLVNSHIIVNSFLGPLILYICVFNQTHVSYLIRKTCCNTQRTCMCCKNDPECEWGDEMAAMNTSPY